MVGCCLGSCANLVIVVSGRISFLLLGTQEMLLFLSNKGN